MNNLMNIILMAQAQGGDQNPLMSFLPLLLIIVVFYFFMIRPQMKKQKDLRKYRTELQQGDKIITTGGIYGKVLKITDDKVLVEVDDNVKLKIDKNAILKEAADIEQKK
jgi:preprotein translocase subunit YajC